MDDKTSVSDRPDYVTDEHLEFLDELRESGVTNMFGARPYLIREFPEDRSGGTDTHILDGIVW